MTQELPGSLERSEQRGLLEPLERQAMLERPEPRARPDLQGSLLLAQYCLMLLGLPVQQQLRWAKI